MIQTRKVTDERKDRRRENREFIYLLPKGSFNELRIGKLITCRDTRVTMWPTALQTYMHKFTHIFDLNSEEASPGEPVEFKILTPDYTLTSAHTQK